MAIKTLSEQQFNDGVVLDTPVASTWVRNAGWLALPDVTGQQMFAGLVRIDNHAMNYLALSAAGNYTVDWGDGVVENISSGVQANHLYDYSTYDVAGTTLVTHTGETYKQAIVTVVPNGGNLTTLDLQKRHTSLPAVNTNYSFSWLDIVCEGASLANFYVCTNFPHNGGTPPMRTNYLEQVRLKNNALSGISFQYMFFNSIRIKSVEVFIPITATKLSAMFWYAYGIERVVITGDTSGINDVSSMFGMCRSLRSAPMFNTQSVTTVASMFNGCASLVDVPLYNLQSATTMADMFSGCSALKTIPAFNTVNVTSFSGLFANCYALEYVPFFDTTGANNFSSMFSGCSKIQRVPEFDFSSVTGANITNLFNACDSLIESPPLNVPSATSLANIFSGCRSLKKVGSITTSTTLLTSVASSFLNCYSLEEAPLFNTNAVTNFSSMFQLCYSLKSVPAYNTTAATNMSSMFKNCYKLKTVPLFTTNNVTTMANMFENCYALESVPAFNTGNVTTMSTMFLNCYALRNVPVFDTSKVVTFTNCFNSCFSLEKVEGWVCPTSLGNVIIASMFSGCSALTKLPDFNTSAVNNASSFIQNCTALSEIPDYNFSAVTTGATIFSGCANLTKAKTTGLTRTNSFANMRLTAAAIDDIFTGLGTGTGQTITVTGNPGAATCTPSIAQAKGWAVTV